MIETGKDLRFKIETTLTSIRPFLQADGGDVELVEIDSQMNVKLKLLGACSNCPMSTMTMKAGIEDSLKKAIPQINQVIAVV